MDKLQAIFDRQTEYLVSLRPTYLHNGFLKHASEFPWPLDDRNYQEEFRLLAWRFTEEMIEAAETYYVYAREEGQEAYREEVSDALHFFIELCLVSGVTRSELLSGIAVDQTFDTLKQDSLEWIFDYVRKGHFRYEPDIWSDTIRAIAIAMMELRQRPWRVDFRPTNRSKWVMGLHLTFKEFIQACLITDITPEALHAAYFKKAQTNDKRREEFGV